MTHTGTYEPVRAIAAALDEVREQGGHDVMIHVDGASGAMVAPFIQPGLVWDLQVPRVVSVNTSGHEHGLVYPGLGWVVWRDTDALPRDLVFDVSYLGGHVPTFALNSSRPSAQVLLQHHLFLRLGFEGYARVQQACQDVALHLSGEIVKMPAFDLWNDGSDIPVLAWRLTPGHTEGWNLHHLSERLRVKGWLVPAHPLPDGLDAPMPAQSPPSGFHH